MTGFVRNQAYLQMRTSLVVQKTFARLGVSPDNVANFEVIRLDTERQIELADWLDRLTLGNPATGAKDDAKPDKAAGGGIVDNG